MLTHQAVTAAVQKLFNHLCGKSDNFQNKTERNSGIISFYHISPHPKAMVVFKFLWLQILLSENYAINFWFLNFHVIYIYISRIPK